MIKEENRSRRRERGTRERGTNERMAHDDGEGKGKSEEKGERGGDTAVMKSVERKMRKGGILRVCATADVWWLWYIRERRDVWESKAGC